MTERQLLKYNTYLDIARQMASLSHANKLKVGALLMRDERILASGYNGMPAGGDNVCEVDGHTKDEVVHAEANAVCFAARHGVTLDGATLVCTHAPCVECAKLLLQSGIKQVLYGEDYKNRDGINMLINYGVEVMLCKPGMLLTL